jgi:NhaA family Na+:H+ antiporter
VVGFVCWAFLHESGIHPTIAGVALGLLTPVTPWVDETKFDNFLAWAREAMGAPEEEEEEEEKPKPEAVRRALARAARESISPQRRLENAVHPWSAFVVLPLFALANAGVPITTGNIFDPITLAIIAGLVIGKPLGIFAFTFVGAALGMARKPPDLTWLYILGGGSLAGIGFTMALFIANLAFAGNALESAKLGILLASLIAGMAGMLMLLVLTRKKEA